MTFGDMVLQVFGRDTQTFAVSTRVDSVALLAVSLQAVEPVEAALADFAHKDRLEVHRFYVSFHSGSGSEFFAADGALYTVDVVFAVLVGGECVLAVEILSTLWTLPGIL